MKEVRLTLQRIEPSAAQDLQRVRALGVTITQLAVLQAEATDALVVCVRLLQQPIRPGQAALCRLELQPTDARAALQMVDLLLEHCGHDDTTKHQCSLALSISNLTDTHAIIRMLPGVITALLDRAKSVCVRLFELTEKTLRRSKRPRMASTDEPRVDSQEEDTTCREDQHDSLVNGILNRD